MIMRELLRRTRAALAEALLFPPVPATSEQARDQLQETMRWAWLPPLSGVAVAGNHAHRTRGNAHGEGGEEPDKTH